MKRALAWLVCSLVLGVLLGACGSGGAGDQDGEAVATGTPRSERADRQATIMQQQESRTAEQVSDQVAQGEAAGDVAAQSGDGEAQDLEMVAAGEIDFGHRKGLPFNRNVVGDPDAPVLIVEYSDFQ